MSLEENVKVGLLIDVYGELLSQKQKQMLCDFILNDMSLGEIAENYGISRSAVLDAINKAKQKLNYYEQKLNLCSLKQQLKDACNLDDASCKAKIKQLLEEM